MGRKGPTFTRPLREDMSKGGRGRVRGNVMPALESGCCPVCDRQVPRVRAEVDGAFREVYDCPDDGPIGYGDMPVTIGRWAGAIAGFAG